MAAMNSDIRPPSSHAATSASFSAYGCGTARTPAQLLGIRDQRPGCRLRRTVCAGRLSRGPMGQKIRIRGAGGRVEVRDYLRIARRRWLLIAMCLVFTVGAAAFLTFRTTP